jgi:hypothetical protein
MPWPLRSPRSNSWVPLPDFSFDSPGHWTAMPWVCHVAVSCLSTLEAVTARYVCRHSSEKRGSQLLCDTRGQLRGDGSRGLRPRLGLAACHTSCGPRRCPPSAVCGGSARRMLGGMTYWHVQARATPPQHPPALPAHCGVLVLTG